MANITAVGMPSSLADRTQLIRMLEVTTRGCVRCILETVASVCGNDCVKDRLHIHTGPEPFRAFATPLGAPSACFREIDWREGSFCVCRGLGAQAATVPRGARRATGQG